MNLKQLRCAKGIKQEELAAKIGVSASMISRYERNLVMPTEDQLLSIAKALDTTIESLMGEYSPPAQQKNTVRKKKISLEDYDKLKISTVYDRSVTESVLEQSRGICELCNTPAPFNDLDGKPYLETHYVKWLAHGGEPITTNLVALCSNCHKRIHILNSPEDNELLRTAAAMHKPVSRSSTKSKKAN